MPVSTAASPTNRRPLIGLFPRAEERANGNGHALFTQTPLMRAVQAAGGLALTLSPSDDPAVLADYLKLCDGFVIPGGGDIDPARYGEPRHAACGRPEDFRDDFELALLPLILEADKPLLGICRGHQMLNVAQGGTLWQDIPSQPESTPRAADPVPCHHAIPFDRLCHTVAVKPDSLLERALGPAQAWALPAHADSPAVWQPWPGTRSVAVNSLHHQSVKHLGDGLEVVAWAPDGTVEALEMPDRRFALTVQWHPEFLWEHDAANRSLFETFVAAARQ